MSERYKVPEPLNSEERYLYGICVRLDDITELLLDLLEPSEEKEEEVEAVHQALVEEGLEEHPDQENLMDTSTMEYDQVTKQDIIEQLFLRGVEYNKYDLKGELFNQLKEYK